MGEEAGGIAVLSGPDGHGSGGEVTPGSPLAEVLPVAEPVLELEVSSNRVDCLGVYGVAREVLSFYRVGDVLTGSGVQVKVETLKTRLLGGPQRAVAILVSAEDSAAGVSARPAIDDFLRALGPLDRLADRSAGLD